MCQVWVNSVIRGKTRELTLCIIGRGEMYGDKRRWGGRERMSWCQPWHRHASRSADGAMRWHFALHFLQELLLPAGKGRRREGGEKEMHLERWIKQSEEEGEMMRRERSDERLLTRTFASSHYSYPPALQLLLQHSLFVASFLTSLESLPSFYSLVSLQKQTEATLCQQARPRYVEEALLFLMRYPLWDFKHPLRPLPSATPAQSGGRGEVRVRRGRMEEGIKEMKQERKKEASKQDGGRGKEEEEEGKQAFSNLSQGTSGQVSYAENEWSVTAASTWRTLKT